MDKFPIYKMVIDDSSDTGLNAVALVDTPAIERLWMTFNKDSESDEKENKFSFAVQSEDRRIVTGPLLIANLPIYRKAEDGSEFYVVFDAPTIEQLVMKYHKDGFQHSVNLMHNGQQVDGVFMFESFIIDSKRGISAPAGFSNVPDGSYFVSYKIENDEVWNLIKTDTFKGFSAEGFFLKKLITATEEEVINRLRQILS